MDQVGRRAPVAPGLQALERRGRALPCGLVQPGCDATSLSLTQDPAADDEGRHAEVEEATGR